MAKTIMIQGTMSGSGKSLITAGLCRVFMQDGHKAAPFKSQNMALNSFITKDGLEMGRAQVMQAEAAGIEPEVAMNPILLKPTNDVGSQVIVNGEVLGNMSAVEYFAYKKKLIPDIKKAFASLEEKYDIIVIEGAGSPAEINLRENDIVNMGLAEIIDSPVLLVADIDRGGVFAQLLGTVELLAPSERARVKGMIINKFRGDKTILDPGIAMLEERCGIPVTGTLPYLNVSFDDEDSLSERLTCNGKTDRECIDITVIRYPRISNFTDFNVFEYIDGVNVRYISEARKMGNPDIIFLPGSKNTMADLNWMRETGLEAAVLSASKRIPVFGICGGYQMLGEKISDPDNVEQGGEIRGMRLLAHSTVLLKDKIRKQVHGRTDFPEGFFGSIKDAAYSGYEIHMGETKTEETTEHIVITGNGDLVYGSYVHGLFDDGSIAEDIVKLLAKRKGISTDIREFDYAALKEHNYDLLADMIRKNLDMGSLYDMLREAAV